MALNSATAYHGLQGTATHSSAGVAGSAAIGNGQTSTNLTAATHAVTFAVELDGVPSKVDLDLSTLEPTLYGAGAAQVETATAVGTITGSGNASVTITSALVTGSPLTVSVAVTNTDTAATWAGKVRTALAATTAITTHYTVGGASDTITLTALVVATNDATLNIALADGTCTGITAAPTSANTTAGYVGAKCYRLSGVTWVGDDFEGADAPTPVTFYGLEVVTSGTGSMTVITGQLVDQMGPGEVLHKHSTAGLAESFGPLQTLELAGVDGGGITAIVTLMYST